MSTEKKHFETTLSEDRKGEKEALLKTLCCHVLEMIFIVSADLFIASHAV